MLLLDEPFSALDRRTREETQREFLAFRGELFGTRIYELRDGDVVE